MKTPIPSNSVTPGYLKSIVTYLGKNKNGDFIVLDTKNLFGEKFNEKKLISNLAFLKNLGVIESYEEKGIKIKISQNFKENYLNVYSDSKTALYYYLQDNWNIIKELFRNNEDITIETIKNFLQKQNLFQKKAHLLEKKARLIYLIFFSLTDDLIQKTINQIAQANTEKEKYKRLVEFTKRTVLSYLDYKPYLKSIIDQLITSDFIKKMIKKNFNGNIKDFLGVLLNDPDLIEKIAFEKHLPNFSVVYEKIEKSLEKKDTKILVLTDVDNDGTNGMAFLGLLQYLLPEVFDNLEIHYAYPSKKDIAKHGITFSRIKQILKNDKTTKYVIYTIDNGSGIENMEEIKKILKEYPNVEVIVTDHHSVGYDLDSLPPEIKNRFTIMNFTLLSPEDRKEKLRGYEITGATTGVLPFFSYIKKLLNEGDLTPDVFNMIENAFYTMDKYSTILDMVKGAPNTKIIDESILDKISGLGNKLNSIATMETFLKMLNLPKDEYLERLKGSFGINDEMANYVREKLIELEKRALISLVLFREMENFSNASEETINKTINAIIIHISNLYSDYENNIIPLKKGLIERDKYIEDLFEDVYSPLYNVRKIYFIMDFLSYLRPIDDIVFTTIKNFNILNEIKRLEKEIRNQVQLPEGIFKIKEDFVKFIDVSEKDINRKLALKTFAGIGVTNEGVLIITDNYKENADELTGSIRMLNNIKFADVFSTQHDKEIEKLFEPLSKIGLKIEIRGHEAGAAGIIIKRYKTALQKIKQKENITDNQKAKEILFKTIVETVNKSYQKQLSKLENENKISDNFKILLPAPSKTSTINSFNYLDDILNILNKLKIPAFTNAGTKFTFEVVVPLSSIKIVDSTGTKHIKPTIENIKNHPEVYLLTDFGNINLIIPKPLLLGALENGQKYISFTPLSSNAYIAQSVLKERPKNVPKLKIEETIHSKLINEQIKKAKESENGIPEQIVDLDTFIENHHLLFEEDKESVKETIKKMLENEKETELLVLDVEAQLGRYNPPFNATVLKIYKDKNGTIQVKQTPLLPDVSKLSSGKFSYSPFINKLTGLNYKNIKKLSQKLEQFANKNGKTSYEIINDWIKENILKPLEEGKNVIFTAHNLIFDDRSMSLFPAFKEAKKYPNFIYFDTMAEAREKTFGLPDNTKLVRLTLTTPAGIKIPLGISMENGLNDLNRIFGQKTADVFIKLENGNYLQIKEKHLFLVDVENGGSKIDLGETKKIVIEVEEIKNGKFVHNFYNLEGEKIKSEFFAITDINTIEKKEEYRRGKKYSVEAILDTIASHLVYKELRNAKNEKNPILPEDFITGIKDLDSPEKKGSIVYTINKNKEKFSENVFENIEILKKEFSKFTPSGLVEFFKKVTIYLNLNGEKNLPDAFKDWVDLFKQTIEMLAEEVWDSTPQGNLEKFLKKQKKTLEKVTTEDKIAFLQKQTMKNIEKFFDDKNFEEKFKKEIKKTFFNFLKYKNYNQSIHAQLMEILIPVIKDYVEMFIIYKVKDKMPPAKKIESVNKKLQKVLQNEIANIIGKNITDIITTNNPLSEQSVYQIYKEYNPELDIDQNIRKILELKTNTLPITTIYKVLNQIEKLWKKIKEEKREYIKYYGIKNIKEFFEETHLNTVAVMRQSNGKVIFANNDPLTEFIAYILRSITANGEERVNNVFVESMIDFFVSRYMDNKFKNLKPVAFKGFGYYQITETYDRFSKIFPESQISDDLSNLKKQLEEGYVILELNSTNNFVAKVELTKPGEEITEEDLRFMREEVNKLIDLKRYLSAMEETENCLSIDEKGEIDFIIKMEKEYKKRLKNFEQKYGKIYLLDNIHERTKNLIKKVKGYFKIAQDYIEYDDENLIIEEECFKKAIETKDRNMDFSKLYTESFDIFFDFLKNLTELFPNYEPVFRIIGDRFQKLYDNKKELLKNKIQKIDINSYGVKESMVKIKGNEIKVIQTILNALKPTQPPKEDSIKVLPKLKNLVFKKTEEPTFRPS